MNLYMILDIIIVFIFGLFWSFIELLLRYKDWKYIFNYRKKKDKKKKDKNTNTNSDDLILDNKGENVLGYVIFYIVLNGIVSIIALFLIVSNTESTINSIDFKNIIYAGFGGMIILRSSIFTIKYNNKNIEIGFAAIVQAFFDAIDKKINHNIAARRVCDIYEIMKNVDFDLAKEELPALCIEFIDYFTDEDSKDLVRRITEINSNFENINKSLQLGREIAKYCDTEILRKVIKKLPHIHIKESTTEMKVDEFELRKSKLNE